MHFKFLKIKKKVNLINSVLFLMVLNSDLAPKSFFLIWLFQLADEA